MVKAVLSNVTNAASLSTINSNFQKIANELQERVAYRDNPDGEPNAFKNDVDLDGNDLYNVGTLVAERLLIDGETLENYLSAAGLPDILSYKRNAIGAVTRTFGEIFSETLSVLEFGAKADCTGYGAGTNNTPMFQAAFNEAMRIGAQVHIPAGKYRLGFPGVKIEHITGQVLETSRASISGDGARSTLLLCDAGEYRAISVTGEASNQGGWSGQHVSGLSILKADNVGQCLYLDNHYHIAVKDVRTNGGEYGIFGLDLLASSFSDVRVHFAKYGVFLNKGDFSQPNAISFYNTTIANNLNWGLNVKNPSGLVYVGGSIEGNFGGTDPIKFGARLLWDTPSVGEGSTGATFIGTYFELNDGVADIWLSSPDTATTLTLLGCTYQRHPVHSTNCVLFESGDNVTPSSLNMIGNAFKGYNGYVPSPLAKYVKIVSPSSKIKITDLGNLFVSALEKPDFSAIGPHNTQSAMVSAATCLSSSSGTMSSAFNVSSVIKTGTGLYTVNYARPLSSAGNVYNVTVMEGLAAYGSPVNDSPSFVQIAIKTFAGEPVDARFSLTVFGGNDIAG